MEIRFDGNEAVGAYADRLSPYLVRLKDAADADSYSAPESSLRLPSDAAHQKSIKDVVGKIGTDRLRYVFVAGIGGANLGSRALYNALYGLEANLDLYHPQVLWLDTISGRNAELISALLSDESLEPEDVAGVVSSKSGTTTETITNAELLLAALYARFGDRASRRVVFISDSDSPLARAAELHGVEHIEIPARVGGRFSIFSAANMVAAQLAGVVTDDLLSGAADMRERCLGAVDNPALAWAAAIDTAYREGKRVHDMFLFSPELESLGKWYRQLMAESLGKRQDREGKEVRAGMLPTVSVGSTDLHSVAQLYFGGPKLSFTTFVTVSGEANVQVPNERSFPEIAPQLSEKDIYTIKQAITEGTKEAYREADMPFATLILDSSSARELGGFMQCAMISVILLGELWNVNAFDQPEVEIYKEKTRKILDTQ